MSLMKHLITAFLCTSHLIHPSAVLNRKQEAKNEEEQATFPMLKQLLQERKTDDKYYTDFVIIQGLKDLLWEILEQKEKELKITEYSDYRTKKPGYTKKQTQQGVMLQTVFGMPLCLWTCFGEIPLITSFKTYDKRKNIKVITENFLHKTHAKQSPNSEYCDLIMYELSQYKELFLPQAKHYNRCEEYASAAVLRPLWESCQTRYGEEHSKNEQR